MSSIVLAASVPASPRLVAQLVEAVKTGHDWEIGAAIAAAWSPVAAPALRRLAEVTDQERYEADLAAGYLDDYIRDSAECDYCGATYCTCCGCSCYDLWDLADEHSLAMREADEAYIADILALEAEEREAVEAPIRAAIGDVEAYAHLEIGRRELGRRLARLRSHVDGWVIAENRAERRHLKHKAPANYRRWVAEDAGDTWSAKRLDRHERHERDITISRYRRRDRAAKHALRWA